MKADIHSSMRLMQERFDDGVTASWSVTSREPRRTLTRCANDCKSALEHALDKACEVTCIGEIEKASCTVK